jgi:hypothetical protein
MNEQAPLPYGVATRGEIDCMFQTVALLARHRLRLPNQHVGMRLRFDNGTAARVYRETVVADRVPTEPCVLVVEFRLRLIHGWAHTAFRWESLLNTPLFAGFPGFVSKLWLAHDEHGTYRGVYEWDRADQAEHYARCLWRVLTIGSVPSSIHYFVLPGVRREEFLQQPGRFGVRAPDTSWWRLSEVA